MMDKSQKEDYVS